MKWSNLVFFFYKSTDFISVKKIEQLINCLFSFEIRSLWTRPSKLWASAHIVCRLHFPVESKRARCWNLKASLEFDPGPPNFLLVKGSPAWSISFRIMFISSLSSSLDASCTQFFGDPNSNSFLSSVVPIQSSRMCIDVSSASLHILHTSRVVCSFFLIMFLKFPCPVRIYIAYFAFIFASELSCFKRLELGFHSQTRGHRYKILKPRVKKTTTLYSFMHIIVNIWNSLPDSLFDLSFSKFQEEVYSSSLRSHCRGTVW